MAARKVTYASVSDMAGAQEVFTTATTWGALKREVQALSSFGRMEAWVRNPDGSEGYKLSNDGTALPEDNFEVVFLNNKNDSGN
jgi:hypothetical protein